MMEIQVNLPDQERLTWLISDYYKQAGKGCTVILIDLFTDRSKRRTREISQLVGIEGPEIMKLFFSINLICVGSIDKKDASRKVHDAFMKGTTGGQRTGDPKIDKKIENSAYLAKIALDQYWEQRARRSNSRLPNSG